MAEPQLITLSFQELAELMVKKQGIHSGLWGIFVRFGIGAANASDPDGQFLPTALVPVREIGIQKFDNPSNLTVDAAEVNPRPKGAKRKSPRATGRKTHTK